MRRTTVLGVFLALHCLCCFGQQRKRMTLETVISVWSDPIFETSHLQNLIDNVGVDFEMTEPNLASLLEAAQKGKRNPQEVANVVFRLIKECLVCRDQLWGPLTKDEVLSMLRKGSAFTSEKVRERGLKDNPVEVTYLDSLRSAGAKDDLINAIDERVTIQPPAGFHPLPGQRASNFTAASAEGLLTLRVEVDGQAEFQFRHNAIFWKAMAGPAPKDLGSSFTTFAPRVPENLVDFTVQQVQPKPGKPKKGKELPVVGSFLPDPSGRNGFRLLITNPERGPRMYEVQVRWHVLNSPKQASAPPKKS